ncbi:MAG: hypothetical protein IT445_12595 [Phycisphaeraceae bacterium]|nr:hypothetical protein [Phycisphaeraceae bacterium]
MNIDLGVEIVVIVVYLLFLLVIGWLYSKASHDVSDYFRGGGKAVWWMVGLSAFMSGISAFTFTGNAGAAYEAGWAVAAIYMGNAAAFIVNALFIGPWLRQLRMITFPEALRARFGRVTQQFYAWLSVIQSMCFAAMPLFALGIFCSAVFKLNLYGVIAVLGVVVVSYSVMGGRWAVMAADFLQGVLMMVVTTLLAVLCLYKVGGIGGFFQAVRDAGLADDFQMLQEPGVFPLNRYTIGWATATFFVQLLNQNSLTAAPRYFSVKDGREARKAALLSAVLMIIGIFTWFIPPMVAHVMYAAEVAKVNLPNPPDASFAVASMELLPKGMLGMVVVAMFAATMSSLDYGLNGAAAMFTQDIYPGVCKLLGVKPVTGRKLLTVGRLFSLLCGLGFTLLALVFAFKRGAGIFQLMLDLAVSLGMPLTFPLILCLFIRKVPPWSAIVTAAAMFGVTILGTYSKKLFGHTWLFQEQMLITSAVGLAVFGGSRLFWRTTSQAYREQTKRFFTLMHTPVDFEKEVGQGTDHEQLLLNGSVLIAASGFCALLLLVPNTFIDRMWVLLVALTIFAIGLLMRLAGARRRKAALAAPAVTPHEPHMLPRRENGQIAETENA